MLLLQLRAALTAVVTVQCTICLFLETIIVQTINGRRGQRSAPHFIYTFAIRLNDGTCCGKIDEVSIYGMDNNITVER